MRRETRIQRTGGWQTASRRDSLPPVEWLTYGSGYLAGMKLGGTPLVEYTRDIGCTGRRCAASAAGQAVMPHMN